MKKNQVYISISPLDDNHKFYNVGITFKLSSDRGYSSLVDENDIREGVRYIKLLYLPLEDASNEVVTINHVVERQKGENIVNAEFLEASIPVETPEIKQEGRYKTAMLFSILGEGGKGHGGGSGTFEP